jgi:hypothetical protein
VAAGIVAAYLSPTLDSHQARGFAC